MKSKKRIVIRQYVEKLITTIQVEGEVYLEVNTIAFLFYSVDLSINLSFHLDPCYQFFYIYIYI